MPKSARSAPSAPGQLTQTITLPQNQPADDPEETPQEKLPFWDQVAAVPDNLWWSGVEKEKGYRIYLYFDEGGRSSYIAVVNEPIDIEWVRREYGGGNYKAHLNDTNNQAQCFHRFRIDGEPKKRPATNVQNAPAAAVPSQDGTLGQVLSQIVELIRENQRETRDLLRESRYPNGVPAQPAPTTVDPTVMFRSMVEMFMGMIPKQQDPIALMIQLKELMGQPRDLLGDLAKLKDAGLIGGSGGDVLQQLTTVLKAAEMMGITGGRGGRSLGEALIEKAPDLLQAIGTGIDKYTDLEKHRLHTAQVLAAIQRNNGQPGAQPAAQVAPAAVGAPRPAAVSPPGSGAQPVAQPLVVEPIGDQVIDQPEPTQGAIVAEMTEAQINTIKQKIVSGIARGMDGADIFGFINMEAPQFIEGFIMRDGSGVVRGVVTEDQLAAFCQHDAILKQATQYPRFRKSIKELLDEVTDFLGLGEEEEPQAPDQAVH